MMGLSVKGTAVHFLLLQVVPVLAQESWIPVTSAGRPRVFLLDARHLQAAQQRVRNGDKALEPALARLRQEAQDALKAGPFSVMHKDATPPSVDKHDYMSQAPYWWPNPDTPNGLPYVRRDGERNPEIYRITDHRDMGRMTEAVETLALAYWFTGDEAHAVRAAQLLRAWFVDPATRMNPHLEYGQAVPGLNTGRGTGLIETIGLTQVVDAVGLLAGSKAWTEEDQRDLGAWFGRFLQWMQESKNGRDEAAAKNNHGTYYDLQVASFALFVGRTEVATEVLRAAGPTRIGRQVEPDGRQPLELERTRAWSYSIMNLRGLMSLARIGENAGVDLWAFQTEDGRSIRKALDYLLPFAAGDRKWPHRQLGGWSPEGIYPLVRRAAARYPDPTYGAIVSKIQAVATDDRSHLLQADAMSR
jgi:hypothetical protein